MAGEKMGQDVADAEFDRFAAAWDLDTDVATMNEEDRDGFESLKRRLTRAVIAGRLVVGDDGNDLNYALGFSSFESLTTIRFQPPGGEAVLVWDKYKDRQNIHKLNAFLGSMTGENPAVFTKMDGRDLKVCQSVAQLFLGS